MNDWTSMPLNLHPMGQKAELGRFSGASFVEEANLDKNKPPNPRIHPTGFTSLRSARQRVMRQLLGGLLSCASSCLCNSSVINHRQRKERT
jgi:hypothetical protein